MVNIEGKTIGNGNPIYIVFEVGPTHNGLDSAKRLVKAAADAGADAVKFQILDAERLVRDPNMMVEYGYLASKNLILLNAILNHCVMYWFVEVWQDMNG